MAVNVITEFGANTKKFDKAVEKSSQKAKKNLEEIGKGARVAGGAISQMGEKLNNLFTGGKLGLIVAAFGAILQIVQQISAASKSMFEKSLEDSEKTLANFKMFSNLRKKKHSQKDAAMDFLRSIAGKDSLTNMEQAEAQRAIGLLRTQGAIGAGVAVKDNRLVGFSAKDEAKAERELIKARKQEIETEMRLLRQQIQIYDDEITKLTEWRWSRLTEGLSPSKLFTTPVWPVKYLNDLNEAPKLEEKKQGVMDKIAALIAELNELENRNEMAEVNAEARFRDIDEAARKKAEEEERKRKIKELTEKRSQISFLGAGQSQMFTNSLTSRGGWARGGVVWDTSRYQQQMLQYNQQQQATLADIEKQLEELQRI